MKTLRFIGMALFAILMCTSFIACSEEGDDPIGPTPTPEVPKSEITIDANLIKTVVYQLRLKLEPPVRPLPLLKKVQMPCLLLQINMK